jgi:hypothetical protein
VLAGIGDNTIYVCPDGTRVSDPRGCRIMARRSVPSPTRSYGGFGLGDVPIACPPGLVLTNGVCGPPPPTLFQRIGSALTGFFSSPPPGGFPPGYVPPQTSITDSPLFIPGLIGVGIVGYLMLKKD